MIYSNMNYRRNSFSSSWVYSFIQQFKELSLFSEIEKNLFYHTWAYKECDNASIEVLQLARVLLNECAPVWVSSSSSLRSTCMGIHEHARSILLWYLYRSLSARASLAHLCQTLCSMQKPLEMQIFAESAIKALGARKSWAFLYLPIAHCRKDAIPSAKVLPGVRTRLYNGKEYFGDISPKWFLSEIWHVGSICVNVVIIYGAWQKLMEYLMFRG